MSYFTPIHLVFYHIMINVLAPTSDHKMDMTHIGLHLFYGFLRGIQINLGIFVLKYIFLCKDDSTKGLAYGRILIKFF